MSACSRSKNKHVYTSREGASVDLHSGSAIIRATIAHLHADETGSCVPKCNKAVGRINSDKSEAHLPGFFTGLSAAATEPALPTRQPDKAKPELHILSLHSPLTLLPLASFQRFFCTLVLLLFACIANRAVWGSEQLQV